MDLHGRCCGGWVGLKGEGLGGPEGGGAGWA